MNSDEDPARRNPWVVAGQLTAVAWEFFGSIIAGAAVGYFADWRLGLAPWGLILGTLLGTSTGLYRMVVILRHFERRKNG
jgi:F0F1-type ATP synthase assembly protein I